MIDPVINDMGIVTDDDKGGVFGPLITILSLGLLLVWASFSDEKVKDEDEDEDDDDSSDSGRPAAATAVK